MIYRESACLGVLSDITQETLERRKIEYERDYDLLTNLLNRRAFHAYMQDLFRHASSIKTAAFMLWDLDNLKYVNDTYGHDYGDTYIRKTADVLKQFMLHNNAIVSRMSGDEFYIFLYGYDSKDEIRSIINSIKADMDATPVNLPSATESRIRASVGISWYPDDASNYFDLIKYADFAMYTVKNTSKGRIAEFDRSLYDRDAFLLHSDEELNLILEQESVDYSFQPIVNARTGDIFAYEALMRPNSETLITPSDVLRIAHSQVQLHRVEKLTLFCSMLAFAQYPDALEGHKIFVNTLPCQMLDEEDILAFREEFHGMLDHIVFELMESEHLNEFFLKEKIRYIQKWNAQIAIDDYGAGYSNDSVLLSLNPDYVKIDMSIVRNVDTDQNRQMLIENLLAYFKSRNILTIAEGVETAAEMRMLISYGVDYLQGFYVGKPTLEPAEQCPRAAEIRKFFAEENEE
ncbi:MAG: bifunctional diguanylate cyclase/phosphodiesterase [Christensenella sp.]|uniref:bifunctional diguanylate cyclase/phosphodiesterase n=1 Tax=Christensenella sp. TaxID=1935934 RepID=UPI002B21B72A|nr:bifunctional diguanylate cyclase/phosphodiesterase [Christensenella sp.]MEA5004172.1 bifunctional diguanylate cyclase/phosphodiesterase [Christensenella sp.]